MSVRNLSPSKLSRLHTALWGNYDQLHSRLFTEQTEWIPTVSSASYTKKSVETDCEQHVNGSIIPRMGHPSVKTCYRLLNLACLRLGFTLVEPSNKVLVREEYVALYKLLGRLQKDGTNGVIITGQPGIGKSTFLWLILVNRLLEGQLTYFQFRPDEFYRFDESGCTALSFWRDERIESSDDAWILFDTAQSDGALWNCAIDDSFCKGFVVRTATSLSSPVWDRAAHFRPKIETCIMKPWGWVDIYVAGFHLRGFDAEHLRYGFAHFGPVARYFFGTVVDAPSESLHWSEIRKTVRGLKSARTAVVAAKSGTDDGTTDRVFLVVPDENRSPLATIVSYPVAKAIAEGTQDEMVWDVKGAFDLMSIHPYTKLGAVWLFKAAVHRFLRREGKIAARALGKLFKSLGTFSLTSISRSFTDMADLRGMITVSFPEVVDYYLWPELDDFPDVSSFIIHRTGSVCLFRISCDETELARHPLGTDGFEVLRDLLPASHQPSEKKPWSLIFVVPSNLVDLYKKQLKKEMNSKWSHLVRRYVLSVNIEQVFSYRGIPCSRSSGVGAKWDIVRKSVESSLFTAQTGSS